MSSAVKEIVTNRILELINDTGNLPWNHPGFMLDRCNAYYKRPYSALNQLMLSDCEDRFFLTYKQVKAHEGKWTPGTKPHIITFWKIYEKKTGQKDANGNEIVETTPVLRFYKVLEFSDVSGLTLDTSYERPPIDPIDVFIAKSGVPIVEDPNLVRASFHSTSKDVHTPPIGAFMDKNHYYVGLTKAMIRWTSLQFETRDPNDTSAFGMESLTAEIGSAMIRKAYDIPWDDSPAEISHWVRALMADKGMIVIAASRAERAVASLRTHQEETDEGADIFAALRGL